VDRFRPGPILCAGVLAVGASSALLIDVASIPKAMTAMIMMGVGQSLIAPTATATTARFFGRDHHGAIRSAITRAGILATGLGPLVFGASQRWAAGYDPALLAFALLCLPVALASLWLTRSMITGSRAASHRGRTS
jgi:sugar phosphate permease